MVHVAPLPRVVIITSLGSNKTTGMTLNFLRIADASLVSQSKRSPGRGVSFNSITYNRGVYI